MTNLGQVKETYPGIENRKNISQGKIINKGPHIEIKINSAERKIKYNNVMVSWIEMIDFNAFRLFGKDTCIKEG